MISNFHTHTKRCHHAGGEDEAYVKYAIERGLKVLGFSDHTPYFYDGGYISPAKMLPSEADGYFESLLHLREKYKGTIEIKIGFETEYYPLYFDRLVSEYRKYPLDYIILGQHFIGNEGAQDAESAFGKKTDRRTLTRYVNQCAEALSTGRFTYFAHPDVIDLDIKTAEDEQFTESEYERLIRAAMKTETPLEINLCGVRSRRNYPVPAFWRTVGRLGCEVVVGCDAHSPSQVADPVEIGIAKTIIKENNLNFKESFPLKNPLF